MVGTKGRREDRDKGEEAREKEIDFSVVCVRLICEDKSQWLESMKRKAVCVCKE